MSVAALEAGKHVFCQARMARDLQEARKMVAAAQAAPGLVNMICPPPSRMPYEPYIRDLLGSGKLGTITSVELTVAGGGNLDPDTYTWREDRELSGNQILAVGIYAETLNAWLGPFDRLSAETAIPFPEKRTADGSVVVKIPQVLTISGRLESGALVSEHHTGLAAPEARGAVLTVRGRDGSLRHRFGDAIPEISDGSGGWTEAEVPPELTRPWRVEQDFVEAVLQAHKGERWSVSPDFEEGLAYMKKMEAIHLSAADGKAVRLSEL
jgi:predicted dehydrogenase